MRILIEGDESADVLKGYIQKAGYVPGTLERFDYRIKIEASDCHTVMVDSINSELEKNCINQMELNGIDSFILIRRGGVNSDREIIIRFPLEKRREVEKGIYQGLMLTLNNYAYNRENSKKWFGILVLLLSLFSSNLNAQPVNSPIIRVFDTSFNIVLPGDFANNAVRVNCIVGCGAGAAVQDINLHQYLGATPSATNPIATRLSNGTSFIDPRDRNWTITETVTVQATNLDIRDLTKASDSVTAAISQTGTENDTDSIPAATASVINDGACLGLTTTSATIAASNSARRFFTIYLRETATDIVFIKLGATATTSDLPLAPGQSFTLSTYVYTGAIDGRSNTGTQSVCWVEL